MSHNTSKRRREEEENDNVSINSSMDNTNGVDAKDAKLAALESKNALLEARNEILEGKLENQELRAKIRELMEENASLKQTNVEQKVQMDDNKEIVELMEQQQKELDDLKAKSQTLATENEAFGKKAVEMEQKAQREMNELKQTIQLNEIKMEALAEGMAILKERQETQEIRMEPERLWNQLIKAKKFGKPSKVNYWNRTKTTATISLNGLQVSAKKWSYAVAMKAFGFAGNKDFRTDHFPGTIIYYYEMTQMPLSSSSSTAAPAANSQYFIGLSAESIAIPATAAAPIVFGKHPNSYAMHMSCTSCLLSGVDHRFERPTAGGIKLELNGQGDVIGCGLVLSPNAGIPIPISPSVGVDRLYPKIFILNACLEANFGDDQQAKPFKYDIGKCPGMVFE